MKAYGFRLHVLFAALVLAGCSTTGGQIASFEDLTTEAKKEGFSKLPQYRVISIPGLLPFADVGGVHFYKSKRKPSSAIGISIGKSYAIETTIDGECDLACLDEVKQKILEVKVAAARLVDAKIGLMRSGMTNKPPEPEPQPQENATPEQSEQPEPQTSATPDPTTETADTTPDADNKQTAATSYESLRAKLDEKYSAAVNAIKNTGVIVFRWNTNTQKSGTLGFGTLFGASGSSDQTQSGFGLISGLKTTTLYLGEDIEDTWGRLDERSKFSNRFEVTTYAMQAKYIIYLAEDDLSTSLGANLSASYNQLSHLSETIKGLDRIELQAALSKVSNLGNMGVIGGAKWQKLDIDWKNPGLTTAPEKLEGWQTIYAVKSDLSELLEMSRQLFRPGTTTVH